MLSKTIVCVRVNGVCVRINAQSISFHRVGRKLCARTANLVVHSKITNRCVSSNTSNAQRNHAVQAAHACSLNVCSFAQCSCYMRESQQRVDEKSGEEEKKMITDQRLVIITFVFYAYFRLNERTEKKRLNREWKRTKKKREMKTTSVL